MLRAEDTTVLTLSAQVEVESIDQLLDLDKANMSAILDKKNVTHPADYLTAAHLSFAFTGCLTLHFLNSFRKQYNFWLDMCTS